MGTVELMMKLIRSVMDGSFDIDLAATDISDGQLEKLYKLSDSHDLSHLVACALERKQALPEGSTGDKLRRRMMLAAYRYEGQAYELARIGEALENSEICYVALKGSVLCHKYPQPWMRTMSDIDILVKREDADRASDMLCKKLGYTVHESGSHDISLLSSGGVHIELHYSLTDEETTSAIGRDAGELLESVWDYAHPISSGNCQYVLCDGFFYLYHLAHTAKHVLHGGCGVKPFIDLYVLDKSSERCEKDREQLLREAGLLQFADCMRQLADVWLAGKEHDEVSSELEAYVIGGGVYGTTENRITVGQARQKGKLGYALSRVFLPYSVLKQRYPVLQKHKWLTPFFEVVRWFSLLSRGGVKRSATELKLNAGISGEQTERAERLMKNIGL